MRLPYAFSGMLVLCFSACNVQARVRCSMESRAFSLLNETSRYVVRAIRPAMRGDLRVDSAHTWLERFAKFVEQDARQKGYINAQTKPHYDRELTLLREGYWPTVIITEAGSGEIIAGVTFAIRWSENDLLPFQHRFLQIQSTAVDFTARREVLPPLVPKEFTLPQFQAAPSKLFFPLPKFLCLWSTGEGAEVKFLTSRFRAPFSHRALPFYWVLHDRASELELFRFSRIPNDKTEMLESYRTTEGDPLTNDRYLPNLMSRILPDGMFYEFISRQFTSPFGRQDFVRIKHIYSHVSALATEGEKANQLGKLYRYLFGFPEEPHTRFREHPKWGTEGVLTEIYQMTDTDYDQAVSRQLIRRASGDTLKQLAHYSPHEDCARLVGFMERDFVKIRGGYASGGFGVADAPLVEDFDLTEHEILRRLEMEFDMHARDLPRRNLRYPVKER